MYVFNPISSLKLFGHNLPYRCHGMAKTSPNLCSVPPGRVGTLLTSLQRHLSFIEALGEHQDQAAVSWELGVGGYHMCHHLENAKQIVIAHFCSMNMSIQTSLRRLGWWAGFQILIYGKSIHSWRLEGIKYAKSLGPSLKLHHSIYNVCFVSTILKNRSSLPRPSFLISHSVHSLRVYSSENRVGLCEKQLAFGARIAEVIISEAALPESEDLVLRFPSGNPEVHMPGPSVRFDSHWVCALSLA